MEITAICPCGTRFQTTEKRVNEGRGKFCSHACKYKYRVMPKRGIGSYTLVKENPTWFEGGHKPWNKGRRDLPPPVNFKKTGVGYAALHDWVDRHAGRACKCKHCGKADGRIEWANKSHEYKRDLKDWIQLCKSCHAKYDRKKGWGVATRKFNLAGKR